MRIRFLTACLEPGKDGVGDYAASLAAECGRQGHEVEAIAFNDRFVDAPMILEAPCPVLRLPAAFAWSRRLASALDWMQGRPAPDWASLQFVPYGFHPKGLVHGWADRLRPLIGAARPHLMFHEIWIGASRTAPVKDRVTGFLQKHLLARLLRALRPGGAHTSNPAYAAMLQRAGIPARVLPLFSNIPVASGVHDWPSVERLTPKLAAAGCAGAARKDWWVFGFFGTLHPVWPPEPLLGRLAEAARQAGKKIGVLSIGRLGSGEALWQRLEKDYAPGFTFERVGEQSPGDISGLLRNLDFGIATSPLQIVGKSGSVAAMREHGVPVIVNRFDTEFPIEIPVPDCQAGLIPLDANFETRLLAAGKRPPEPALPAVAARFLEDLQAAARRPGPVPTTA